MMASKVARLNRLLHEVSSSVVSSVKPVAIIGQERVTDNWVNRFFLLLYSTVMAIRKGADAVPAEMKSIPVSSTSGLGFSQVLL